MGKQKIFFYSLLCIIAGVAVASFFVFPVWLSWIFGVAGVLGCVMGVSGEKKQAFFFGIFLLVFLIGTFRAQYVAERHAAVRATPVRGEELSGVVWEDPQLTAAAQHLKVKVVAHDGQPAKNPFFVSVTTRMYPTYEIGDALLLRGAFERSEGSFFLKEGIHFTSAFPSIQRVGKNKRGLLAVMLSKTKHAFEGNISRALPEPHASFLRGLLLGERASLPESFREDLRRTGTSHLVALSGYNITLVGKNFMELLLWLTIPFRASFWFAATAIFLFVTMTGASPSVVRAGIMGILVLVAQREGRLYHMTNALLVAAVWMVLENPFVLRFDLAFQLSFLATIGLVYFSPPLERGISRIFFFFKKKLSSSTTLHEENPFFQKVLAQTLSAQIMVLPLLIFSFGEFSIISVIANPLVIVATPVAMATGFAVGLIGFLSDFLARFAGFASWMILEYQMRIIETLARFPVASIVVSQWVAFPLFLLCGALLLRYSKRRNRATMS